MGSTPSPQGSRALGSDPPTGGLVTAQPHRRYTSVGSTLALSGGRRAADPWIIPPYPPISRTSPRSPSPPDRPHTATGSGPSNLPASESAGLIGSDALGPGRGSLAGVGGVTQRRGTVHRPRLPPDAPHGP